MRRVFLILVLSQLFLAGCQPKDGPAERAGKRVDDAVSNAADSVKDAADDVKDKAQGRE